MASSARPRYAIRRADRNYPVVWLLLLPLRLLGITVDAVFKLLSAIRHLPARLLRGPSAMKGGAATAS